MARWEALHFPPTSLIFYYWSFSKILLKKNVQGLPLENIVFYIFLMIVDLLVLKKNVNLCGS